jgi:UDP-3-O-[3-hydroxymyristoyl] glucosamine N-acyltransferase
MEFKAGDIAGRIGATVTGDPERTVTGVAAVQDAAPGDLTFCAKPRYHPQVAATRAAAVIVGEDYAGTSPAVLLRVADPYRAFLSLLPLFVSEVPERPRGVHPTALVESGARLGQDVSVGALCVVEADAEIGDGVTLAPGVFVGEGARIGPGCYLYPNVTVRERVVLGNHVIVHSGTVLGSDGFGYVSDASGHHKVPQVGTVVVEDDVEIGANVAVDRGTLGETRIGRGAKIDNLVHIAHNVTVGENTLVVAQVGISGSTQVGKDVTLAGQAGLVGHIRIGDGAMVGAQAGVTKDVPAHSRVSGYPAMEHDRARRLNALVRRLPELIAEVKRLEARLAALEGGEPHTDPAPSAGRSAR